MPSLTIDLPDTIAAEEARLALAIALWRSARLSQGQAARLAGLSREEFLAALGSRGEPFTNIAPEDLAQELQAWRRSPLHGAGGIAHLHGRLSW